MESNVSWSASKLEDRCPDGSTIEWQCSAVTKVQFIEKKGFHIDAEPEDLKKRARKEVRDIFDAKETVYIHVSEVGVQLSNRSVEETEAGVQLSVPLEVEECFC